MRIFRRFTRKSKASGASKFNAPMRPETGFFAVGDVHGRDDLLTRLLAKIEARGDQQDCPIIFVGDYVDRGEESAVVLRRLHALSLQTGRTFVFLQGNHEDMMLGFLDNPEEKAPLWLRNGGLQTLSSFQIQGISQNMTGEHLVRVRDELVDKLGPDLLAWLRAMPTQWTSGNVSVVHAGARPDVPLNEQARKTLVWGHPTFRRQARSDGQWVVHGHTIVDKVEPQAGRLGVDTGAYATGCLSAAFVSSDGLDVISTKAG